MADKKRRNPFRGIINYFKEVKSELKKVVWPSFKQIKNNTLIVLVCILIIGAFIWILDAVGGITLGRLVDLQTQEEQNVENTDGESDHASLDEALALYGLTANGDGTYTSPEGEIMTQEEALAYVQQLSDTMQQEYETFLADNNLTEDEQGNVFDADGNQLSEEEVSALYESYTAGAAEDGQAAAE